MVLEGDIFSYKNGVGWRAGKWSLKGRVIPADRRGSCCFLLGIVTVALHGASHAGITDKSSLSLLRNHPVLLRVEGDEEV